MKERAVSRLYTKYIRPEENLSQRTCVVVFDFAYMLFFNPLANHVLSVYNQGGADIVNPTSQIIFALSLLTLIQGLNQDRNGS